MTPEILTGLDSLSPLAPQHQPVNLAPIRILLESNASVPQMACFDTAFHCSHPDVADVYATPARFHAAEVRRYGLHGLSYEYIAQRLKQDDLRKGQNRYRASRERSVHVRFGERSKRGMHDGFHCA